MSSWQDLCTARKQRQTDSIPQEWFIQVPPEEQRNVLDVPRTCGLLTARELEITDTDNVQTILDKLRTAVWSSVEVTTAFYKRAVIAHQLVRPPLIIVFEQTDRSSQTNCLTEIYIERALQRAQEVDDYLKSHGRVIGPLHGLPISLKDQFRLKGMETIMGTYRAGGSQLFPVCKLDLVRRNRSFR